MEIIFKQKVILLATYSNEYLKSCAIPVEISLFNKKSNCSIICPNYFEEIITICLNILKSNYSEIDFIMKFSTLEFKIKLGNLKPNSLYSSMLPIGLGLIVLFRLKQGVDSQNILISGSGRLEKDGQIANVENINLKLNALNNFLENNRHLLFYHSLLIVTPRNVFNIFQTIDWIKNARKLINSKDYFYKINGNA